jgi:hypothetical protein
MSASFSILSAINFMKANDSAVMPAQASIHLKFSLIHFLQNPEEKQNGIPHESFTAVKCAGMTALILISNCLTHRFCKKSNDDCPQKIKMDASFRWHDGVVIRYNFSIAACCMKLRSGNAITQQHDNL